MAAKGPNVKLAVNYSVALAELIRENIVDVDVFKCPLWPETLTEAQSLRPVYAHLPLVILGDGKVTNSEARAEVDWDALDALVAHTETRHINLHPSAQPELFPDIPKDSTAPQHVEQFIEAMIDCVHVAIARYGADNVLVENVPWGGLDVVALPDVSRVIVAETGCGFLFDLSHAQLAARHLGMDAKDYIAQLPMDHIQEMHVTGIHFIGEAVQAHMRELNVPESFIERWAGRWLDHLSFTEDDWSILEWAFEQLHGGTWAQPWVVSMEYGGVGPIWEDLAERHILMDQVPRLYHLVHAETVSEDGTD
ncbi:DUF692 family protein [Phototrophicus methaneseepsis]|uniref:DUF692 family protein n=1 Tax=Phototrophicus methaneseepsis TaxID=2710758 RepID=A0A7S8EAV9_9CHLR|nr:DUF692 family multinuclear iron-containing protein [Phototrophicus methaneseepsis]QPC83552.1 DUF692 family protein [Phototrophicus methaneseepsis]